MAKKPILEEYYEDETDTYDYESYTDAYDRYDDERRDEAWDREPWEGDKEDD